MTFLSLLRVWAISPEGCVCYGLFKVWSVIYRLSWVLSLGAFAGCAAYVPPALTMAHPAHPEAARAPELPPSTTLAYNTSDLPSARPPASAARASASASSPQEKSARLVVGEGQVIAVVPASSEIVLTHGEIKGFMDAMTMGYQIQYPSLLEGVQAGDTVRFTIDTEEKAIVALKKLPR